MRVLHSNGGIRQRARGNRFFVACCLVPVALFWAVSAHAATYYIAANGSDSNNGTSTSTPWLHAPGMTGCSGVCTAKSPQPGDSFIFRGGDTWHQSSGSPVGLPWTWNWSGTSSNPIYIGVDKTWFSGSSWARPIFNQDNPASTNQPASCTFGDDSFNAVTLGNGNSSYITFDNFEFTGACWSVGNGNTIHTAGTHLTISNNYFHGWTMTTTSGVDDTHHMIQGNNGSINNNVIAGNVFDGSDSSLGTTTGKATGFCVYGDGNDFHNNIFRHVSNGIVGTDPITIHDNLFEYMYEPVTSVHGNVAEWVGGVLGQTISIYNNITRHTNEGVTFWSQATVFYEFNNIFYDIQNAGNCLMQNPPGFSSGSGTGTAYIFNNTLDAPCTARFNAANSTTPSWSGPVNFQNNHFIGYSPQAIASTTDCGSVSGCTIQDNGNEVWQTESAANNQGYTPGNNYAPALSGGATLGAGANITSQCNALPDASSKSACESGMTGVSYDAVNHAVIVPGIAAVTRPPSSPPNWDAGAYQFAGTPPPSNTFYIRAGATGNGSGSDWSNACTDFTGSCGVSSLVRGATYYVAAGTYAGVDFNTPESGSLGISILRATTNAHGTSTGWNNTFDGPVTWGYQCDGCFGFSTSHWVFDGVTGPGSGNGGANLANYGFMMGQTSNCAAPENFYMEIPTQHGAVTNLTDVTISHIGIQSCGSANNTFQVCWNVGDGASSGISNIKISYSYCSGPNNAVNSTKVSSLTFDHNRVDNQWSSSSNHGEVIATSSPSAWTLSNNYFDNCAGTACLSVIVGGAIDGFNIYGNIFNNNTTGNGAIAAADTGTVIKNTNIYNNTFTNSSAKLVFLCESGDSACSTATNNNFENNLMWNSSSVILQNNGSAITHDYNAFFSPVDTPPSEPHGQISQSNPFVASASGNYHLASATNAGLTLAAPYNQDMDGNTRGADGVWDRGAYEYVSGTIGSACDLNGDGSTNVSDVQICVNQAIGAQSCTTGDINKDGVCNVIDVQRDVNAALGGVCVTQ